MTEMNHTLKQLLETVENGKRGFAEGAEKMTKDGNTTIAATFAELSQQREKFSSELRALDPELGDFDADGTFPGAIHRGWMALKDALSSDDPHGVLDAAEQGEDHAVKEFQSALDVDLPQDARAIIARQYEQIKMSHDKVRALRDLN